jgi:phosphatidylinositol glycan class B
VLYRRGASRHSCAVARPNLQRKHAWILAGLCVAIVLPRAFVALHDRGLLWSDEIFQTLEQAHRFAFGYGLVPWEFRSGARSWLLPGALGGAMKVLAWMGVGSGLWLAAWLKLGFVGLALLTFYPLLRMAHAWGGITAAVLLGATACVFPANIIYSSRALAEVASAPFLAWGVWLLWPCGLGRSGRATADFDRLVTGTRRTRLLVAGGLLGLAALLRYQVAILLPPIVLVVAARHAVRSGLWLAAGAIGMLAAGGVLDWVTWGHPFQSLVEYLRFNLVNGGASQWGVAKRGFFLRTMLDSNGSAVLVLLVGFFAGLRRTWPVAMLVIVFFVVHSSIAHKELRFLYPVQPELLLCAAVGLAALVDRIPHPPARRRAIAAALASTLFVLFAIRAPWVTFADIGQRMDAPAQGGPTSDLVWGAFDERNLLFDKARMQTDICGLAAPAMNAYWTGGYTYLHRRVPLLWSGGRGDLAAANYAIANAAHPFFDARYRKVAQQGGYALYRRDGSCAPPPPGSTTFGRLSPVGIPGT